MTTQRSQRPKRFIGRMAPADEATRSLLQDRITLFAKTLSGIFVFTIVATTIIMQIYPNIAPPRVEYANLAAFLGVGFLLVVWLLARRIDASLTLLQWLDATMMLGAGLLLGGGAALIVRVPELLFASFSLCAFVILGRVFFVPSAPTRTFWLSLASMTMVTAGDIVAMAFAPDALAIPLPAFAGGAVALGGAVVALATAGSRVLFGLRREVTEAKRLGQYTLGEKIGEGGMGAVYEARHAMLRRRTAIKLLRADAVGPDSLARFEREVQLTSELSHPNVIAVFDYGMSADGAFYYAMEYLDGIDLENLVARYGPMPPGRAIHVLCQVCDALDEAHHRGLIHRDVKPANVILSRRGRAPDVAKVVDFGLVKELAREGAEVTKNVIAGTPAYMAPEAITDPDAIGPAADLYAVGAVGYFLVTGKMVFEGKTLMEVCSHHVHTIPPPPSSRTDRVIPKGLEDILLRCLEKAPSERPPSAKAVGEALRALQEEAPWSEDEAIAWWDDFAKNPRKRDDLGFAETVARDDIALAETVAVTVRLDGRA